MADAQTQMHEQTENKRLVGLLAEFPHPGALVEAVKALRQAGYRKFETYTPFPIHGMDKAMGLGVSKLGFMVFGGAITGALLGTWMQWWMNGVDYPLIISGKPFFSFEPSLPIIFELTILFSALTAVFGMLGLNKLPRYYNPLFNSERFARVTDDGFFLCVDATDPMFHPEKTAELLQKLGATYIEPIHEDED